MSTRCGVALLGVGTVGGGVVEIIRANAAAIARRTGVEISLVSACANNVARAQARVGADVAVFADWREAVACDGVDVVVELIGGEDAAKECALHALESGKPYVTANKALLAAHGSQIIELARRRKVSIHYEAAVAGCVPAIRVVRDSLAGDRIVSIAGILNGTCNYILTKMASEGAAFADILDEAIEIGYAEAEPSLDIDGIDAAHKAVILGWLAFGGPLTMDSITVRGIRGMQTADLAAAREFGYVIKLLALIGAGADGELEAQVTPALIARDHPLASIDSNLNALLVTCAAAGELMMVGAGAGAAPTASAVVADIVEAARTQGTGVTVPAAATAEGSHLPQARSQAYLRVRVIDAKGVIATMTSTLSAADISIEGIHQGESLAGEQVDIAILLHETSWENLAAATAKLATMPEVVEQPVLMPIALPHLA